jgi:hypothetical protein
MFSYFTQRCTVLSVIPKTRAACAYVGPDKLATSTT